MYKYDFNTVEELIKYSNERFSTRFNGNQKVHRASKSVLKNVLINNEPNSLCKTKDESEYLKAVKEFNFRIVLSKMRLPISSKII